MLAITFNVNPIQARKSAIYDVQKQANDQVWKDGISSVHSYWVSQSR